MRTVLVAALVVVLAGCAGARVRDQIRNGLLATGQPQDAFLSVWGYPDKTDTMAGAELTGASWSGGPGGGGFEFGKGRRNLEVWHYESKGADLVFDRKRLTAWHTDKNRAELVGQ